MNVNIVIILFENGPLDINHISPLPSSTVYDVLHMEVDLQYPCDVFQIQCDAYVVL